MKCYSLNNRITERYSVCNNVTNFFEIYIHTLPTLYHYNIYIIVLQMLQKGLNDRYTMIYSVTKDVTNS